ncbi:MAG: inositol-phosphate phosphatase [Gammaproteobacteria bacterium]|nr:inositol-phosphate phosphatase [Gammaproteobacteria bacterium]
MRCQHNPAACWCWLPGQPKQGGLECRFFDGRPPQVDYSTHLNVARRAAEQAAARIRYRFEGHLEGQDSAAIGLEIKDDRTPVTIADKEAEELIRAAILDAFPEHDFYGEETGRSGSESEFLWLVDPLDGTRSFVRRYPFFSTQIALMHNGKIVVGVSSAPIFEETAWAVLGGGAWLNGKELAVSKVDTLEEATISTGNLATLAGSDAWQGLGEIVRRVQRNRGYGDFYHYHLLAAGKIDVVIESDVNILDIAALSLVTTEAGGRFTDLAGQHIGIETRSVLAATPSLWGVVREML